ncbi:MAG: transposase [Trichodesmium sp. St19_bin1]|nr:transposase [Trichodesmium sp. St19_bin1]
MSNSAQISYQKLLSNLSVNMLRKLFEEVFMSQLSQVLGEMSHKDSSSWSKKLVTVVLDDSVFRSWLSSQGCANDFEDCYGKFFSGQFGTCVYGFRVLSLGVSIDGLLYPLFFDFIKKNSSESYQKPVKVAQKLIRRWGDYRKRLAKEGCLLPKLHLSCDSGYSDSGLAESCAQNGLCYISVPKKSHDVEIEGKKVKLSEWIENTFIPAEKAHLVQQKLLPDDQKTAFTMRVSAYYCSKKQAVTLLFFRLNGSKKVSVIYSISKHIFAKTLRRHWFQRTYIEQFFKMLKHVLQIQEARTKDKKGFEFKLYRFAYVAWHAQKLVRWIRKKMKHFGRKGFITIQRTLASDPDILYLLQKQIMIKY